MIPSFPRFTPVTLDHKEDYERLVAEYPPISDISFATLNIWWNLEGKLELAELNGNLVINYHLPFDQENSGLSLIGKTQVDESIQALFRYCEQKGEAAKLVHVPDFVIAQIQDKDQFEITEEPDYNEYILDSKSLASLEDAIHGRTRRKVKRFLREVEERDVELRELDLSYEEAREDVFRAIVAWEKGRPGNDPGNTEHDALRSTLKHAEHLGIRPLGLYIDGKLYAVVLYHKTHDSKYYIMHHLKVDYSLPYIFDYMVHRVANKATDESVQFLNMEMDLGIASLRQHKMGLRPVDFFRKYTVRPAGQS